MLKLNAQITKLTNTCFDLIMLFMYLMIGNMFLKKGLIQAKAGMLQLRRLSLSRQSNPSILTAGLLP
ncbi:hypothetical protein HanIR_Chr12g0576171 [Helianthus annuus]|nr:hypothetical protein HanIR_Chr12g0576171 [Helianthus annuus]